MGKVKGGGTDKFMEIMMFFILPAGVTMLLIYKAWFIMAAVAVGLIVAYIKLRSRIVAGHTSVRVNKMMDFMRLAISVFFGGIFTCLILLQITEIGEKIGEQMQGLLILSGILMGSILVGVLMTMLYNIKVADWHKYIEAKFAFDMMMPDGWTYKEGIIINDDPPIFELRFTTNAKDKEAAYNSLTEYLFGITEKTSTFGNLNKTIDFTNEELNDVWEKLNAVPSGETWHFMTSKGKIRIGVHNKRKYVLLTLILLGDAAVSAG
jgi:hypothetical protein